MLHQAIETRAPALTLRDLHRAWADKAAELQKVQFKISDVQAPIGEGDAPAIALLEARELVLASECRALAAQMLKLKASTPAELAILLDLALEYDVGFPPDMHGRPGEHGKAAHLLKLIREFAELVPDAEFSTVRRLMSGRDTKRVLGRAA